MPYKDPEKQRAAQHRSYERNKAAIYERQRERRRQPGYRDGEMVKRRRGDRTPEYAARLGITVEEYLRRRAAGTLGLTRTEALRVATPRKISAEEREFDRKQREMKAAALRRFGLT